jgi:hypothetical protein
MSRKATIVAKTCVHKSSSSSGKEDSKIRTVTPRIHTVCDPYWLLIFSVCKPEALIQLRFLMMSDITLETYLKYWRKWNNKNSVTELHLVGDLLLAILTCLHAEYEHSLDSVFSTSSHDSPTILLWSVKVMPGKSCNIRCFIVLLQCCNLCCILRYFTGRSKPYFVAALHNVPWVWLMALRSCRNKNNDEDE